MRWTKPVITALCAAFAACGEGAVQDPGLGGSFAQTTPAVRGDALGAPAGKYIPAERPVAGQYIVVMRTPAGLSQAPALERRREFDRVQADLLHAYRGTELRTYRAALDGFAARMDAAAARALAADPRVEFVEEDGYVSLDTTQTGATWGLDRIDQRNLPLDSSYTYNTNGSGVNAYIIDTGIRRTHSEFGGRAYVGYDAVTPGGSADDCHGHGTHVSGTVGGSTYGVAKGVRLYAVRVLDCNGSGTNSGVIAGVDWVTNNHVKPAVANMSLGGGASTALDSAVANSISAGVTYGIAAGNDNANACNSSPARVSSAITVGATTSTDARASYSNYGTCLDLFGPGSSITSSWYTSDTATNTISGTSMATPHVVGAAALYLSVNTSATPQQVRDALVNNGTTGKVTSAGTGSPNVLLYTGFIGGGGGGDTTAPTTSLTAPASGSTVSGTVTVSASASDNVGVTRVEFYVGGTLIGSDTTSPYSLSWNTTTTANGTYTLTSKAYDAAGNVGTSAGVSVTVNNGSGSCSITEQLFLNPGFESGNVSWSSTYGVIDNSSGAPARSGSWKAWLNGYGFATTDTLSQDVTIPATACTATLRFWNRISTSETTSSIAYDKLTVTVRNTSNTVLGTLATYSNLNASSSYVERVFDLSAYKGQTVRIYFYGTEDWSLQTSFLIDDTSLTITR